jgi:hypothetical protein
MTEETDYKSFDPFNHDYTKLSDFCVCLRRGYFAHVRNWQPDVTAAPLVFGIAMHRALEKIYSSPVNSNETLIQNACLGFVHEWREHDLDPEAFHPRSLSHGLEVVEAYVARFGDEIRETRVIAVEEPFKVILEETEESYYHGRLDAVVELPQVPGIYVLEHKTASSFSSTWQQTFSPNMQIDGYCHALNMLHPENAKGVLVNGLLVQKTKMEFVRVPVLRQYEHLDAWRWEVLDKIQDIDFNWLRLREFRELSDFRQQPFMSSFPKNATACSFYGGCRYLDLCKVSSNPEQWPEVPAGFVEQVWDYQRS